MEKIKFLIEKRGWIDIPASGKSMYPLIKEGDICRFVPIDSKEKLTRNDIILFLADQGQLIGHRFSHQYIDKKVYYIFKGDTNMLPDSPVEESQLIGKLTSIKKGHFRLVQTGMIARLWSVVCFTFPMLPRYCVWIWGKEHYHA